MELRLAGLEHTTGRSRSGLGRVVAYHRPATGRLGGDRFGGRAHDRRRRRADARRSKNPPRLRRHARTNHMDSPRAVLAHRWPRIHRPGRAGVKRRVVVRRGPYREHIASQLQKQVYCALANDCTGSIDMLLGPAVFST